MCQIARHGMSKRIKRTVTRWTFVALLTGCAAVWSAVRAAPSSIEVLPPLPVSRDEITLQDDKLRVGFDASSGALIRLETKATHWTIERRPELGISFRLFAPMPDRRWNPVLGQKQHATQVKKISDNELQIQWENLIGESSGALPVTITADITLTNGVLTFNATLKNDSKLTVETIDYPYFGDFNAPTPETPLQVQVMTGKSATKLKADEIHPRFGNEKGYWGVFWPTKIREAQQSRFCLISATNEGVYVEVSATPYKMQWVFEQHPGVISSINDLVPPGDDMAGTPVYLEFRACHFIFAAPASTKTLTPVMLRCYQGDWHTGVNFFQPQKTASP